MGFFHPEPGMQLKTGTIPRLLRRGPAGFALNGVPVRRESTRLVFSSTQQSVRNVSTVSRTIRLRLSVNVRR